MLLSELLHGIPHEIVSGDAEIEISSVEIDSRRVVSGTLFICIKGLAVDGHEFIASALADGAAALLIESSLGQPTENPGAIAFNDCDNISEGFEQSGAAVVRVENTRSAMAFIAANFYGNPAQKLRLIGVTGTNGKTTTTHFIEEILRSCGRKTGLIGTEGVSVNGKPLGIKFATSTTPDPLELHSIFAKMLDSGVQDVVMEVSSHALHFHKMQGLEFAIGVFTNLTQDHLDLHGTMENYRIAKAGLFLQSRFAVVNIDDESSPVMLEYHGGEPFLTYGVDGGDLSATQINSSPDGSEFSLETGGVSYNVRLQPKGRFNIYNALAAIGTVLALGLDMHKILNAVGKLVGVPGRIQSVPNDKGVGAYVDYSHTPDSLENILSVVRDFTPGRLIVVFGCGGDRDRAKRPQMGDIAARLADYCIITSDNPRTEDPMVIIGEIEPSVVNRGTAYSVCENRRDAIFMGANMLKPGDALVVAGKGSEDYQIIGTVKHDFSDYETTLEALSS